MAAPIQIIDKRPLFKNDFAVMMVVIKTFKPLPFLTKQKSKLHHDSWHSVNC